MAAPLEIVHRRTFSENLTSGKNSGRESLAAVAHDARNVLASLHLYCELLAAPGVLAQGQQHVAAELEAVAETSASLVDKLSEMLGHTARPIAVESAVAEGINDLAVTMYALAGPLEVLAGNHIALEMECLPCPGFVPLSKVDLTRILINFTRNAAEAMPKGGRIRITLQQCGGGSFLEGNMPRTPRVLISVQDSGPGVPAETAKRIFDSGFSTKKFLGKGQPADRGLGLSIVKRLAEAAGGSVRYVAAPGGGARFEVELPWFSRQGQNQRFFNEFTERATLKC